MGPVTTPGRSAAVEVAQAELGRYDDLRAGRREAFASLVVDLDPVLRDLGLASTGGDPAAATALVRHTWAVALPGLDLFAWRCSLRAWVAGVLVGLAGPGPAGPGPAGPGPVGMPVTAGRTGTPPAQPPRPAAVRARPGPADWSDLPWGARWSDAAWVTVEHARTVLPPAHRQVLVLADLHGWPSRDAADAVGLTAARYGEVLGAARLAVHDSLEAMVDGSHAGCGHDRSAVVARRWPAVAALLAAAATPPPAGPDPEVMALFRHWRAARRGGLAAWLSRRRRDQVQRVS